MHRLGLCLAKLTPASVLSVGRAPRYHRSFHSPATFQSENQLQRALSPQNISFSRYSAWSPASRCLHPVITPASFASRRHNSAAASTYIGTTAQPGTEPGVDIKRDDEEFRHLVAQCQIDVIEYGKDKASFEELDNQGLLEFLKLRGRQKADWATVRWINVRGIDWEVIKALTGVYGLHSLALEDLLHARDFRSKADYYKDQLFVKGLALLLDDNPKSESLDTAAVDWSYQPFQSSSSAPSHDVPATLPRSHQKSATKTGDPRSHWSMVRQRRRAHRTVIGANGVHARERNVFMFLLRDGTFLSFHDGITSVNDEAIKERLDDPTTVLRESADASVLLQSMLDLMVDHSVQVADTFHEQILYLERETLQRPHMHSVKLLHMLSADVTLHKRALTPLRTLVHGLRYYDMDRCQALAASAQGKTDTSEVVAKGFMSHQSKIYLADVHDHLEYVISSFEVFETISENLIGYSFNALSYATNITIRRLTLATIIFFPLTFLTGYFGMNFAEMPSLQTSEWRFWDISIPCVLALIIMFNWREISRLRRRARFR